MIITISHRICLFLSIVFVYSMYSAVAVGAERSVQDEPQLFTNQDIEKYNSLSETKTTDKKIVLKEDREENRKDKQKRTIEEHEMEYWCKKAATCNRRIEDEKEAIKKIEDEIVEAKTKGRYSHKKNATLEKRLEKAKKRLKDAEADLDDLEHEAHRKGVPPGWLRCQM